MVWRTNFDRFLEDYATSHVIKGSSQDPALQAPPAYTNHAPLLIPHGAGSTHAVATGKRRHMGSKSHELPPPQAADMLQYYSAEVLCCYVIVLALAASLPRPHVLPCAIA
eukprot:scaffold10255_cov22-Tisochrysis_lutea.AAC.5